MCAYRRYGAAYRKRYTKKRTYKRRTSPFKNFRQTSAVKRGNSQKTVDIQTNEKFYISAIDQSKNGIKLISTPWMYSNLAVLEIDLFQYFGNHPLMQTYGSMYSKYWIQGFAFKLKLNGSIVPTNSANIKGQYWFTMSENKVEIPFPNVGDVNYSVEQVLRVFQQNPSTKYGIINQQITLYDKKAYGRPKIGTVWNVPDRAIMQDGNSGYKVQSQPKVWVYLIIQRPVINRYPIQYGVEFETSCKVTFKDLNYVSQLMDTGFNPSGSNFLRSQYPQTIVQPVHSIDDENEYDQWDYQQPIQNVDTMVIGERQEYPKDPPYNLNPKPPGPTPPGTQQKLQSGPGYSGKGTNVQSQEVSTVQSSQLRMLKTYNLDDKIQILNYDYELETVKLRDLYNEDIELYADVIQTNLQKAKDVIDNTSENLTLQKQFPPNCNIYSVEIYNMQDSTVLYSQEKTDSNIELNIQHVIDNDGMFQIEGQDNFVLSQLNMIKYGYELIGMLVQYYNLLVAENQYKYYAIKYPIYIKDNTICCKYFIHDVLSCLEIKDIRKTTPIVNGSWPWTAQPCIADVRNMDGSKRSYSFNPQMLCGNTNAYMGWDISVNTVKKAQIYVIAYPNYIMQMTKFMQYFTAQSAEYDQPTDTYKWVFDTGKDNSFHLYLPPEVQDKLIVDENVQYGKQTYMYNPSWQLLSAILRAEVANGHRPDKLRIAKIWINEDYMGINITNDVLRGKWKDFWNKVWHVIKKVFVWVVKLALNTLVPVAQPINPPVQPVNPPVNIEHIITGSFDIVRAVDNYLVGSSPDNGVQTQEGPEKIGDQTVDQDFIAQVGYNEDLKKDILKSLRTQ